MVSAIMLHARTSYSHAFFQNIDTFVIRSFSCFKKFVPKCHKSTHQNLNIVSAITSESFI
ncbi:unnamed protein product [Meloidogyne enterolobii]|uniref:Uncharacterized protein n=2 Tax=Meloidogyne enterolobii TaxID=390850 RepID=A0ACB0ZE16_MELEN